MEFAPFPTILNRLYRATALLALVLVGGLASASYPQDTGSEQTGPATTGTSDWSPPVELQPGMAQPPPDTDSATPEIPSNPEVTSTEAAEIAPRVDLGGPGTPKWKVITYVSEKNTIDDNIYISHAQKQSDVYFSLMPGVAAGWGDFRSSLLAHSSLFADEYGQTRVPSSNPMEGNYAYVNYTADATHFISHDSQDAVDQDASMFTQWDLTKLLLGLNTRFQTLSGPDIDVGTRTRRAIFTISATAAYELTGKTTLEFGVGGVTRNYSTQLNSSEWDADLYVDYEVGPKTTAGLGLTGGIRQLQSTPNQYYEQVQVRGVYNPTDKLRLQANGGLEVDEAEGSTRANPIFGIGATYIIDDGDAVSLDASRSTSSSAVTSGETVDITGVSFEIRHKLFSSFSLACAVGYQHAEYYEEGLSLQVRTDDYIFVRPSLAYNFAEWSQIELAYEYHRDVSTDLLNDFAENIASLQLNFVF